MGGDVVAQHRYGWRRPLPGLDRHYPRANVAGLASLPEVDPRPLLPPIFDQGDLGSCTANATAAAFEYDATLDGHDSGPLARLWIYYFERKLEHSLGAGDVGAMGHDAYKVATHGIPPETAWPYDIATYAEKPDSDFPRAYWLRKDVHAPAQDKAAFKAVLSNRQTISFGFTVYESFEAQWAVDGLMPVPNIDAEEVLGGHEVLIVGYVSSRPEYALCRNSWGETWGLQGYFFFPWSVLLDPNMASDFRTIVRPL